jgi:phosphate:Na+ symporter
MLLASQTIDFSLLLTSILGGLALFLFGMQRMTNGLKLVAGESMKRLMRRLTENRFTAAAAGALITAVIQSSSITTVLVVGLITAELMTFSQSIGVILGANVGTTITAQIVAFKVSKYGLVLVAVGFLGEAIARREVLRQSGQALMGLGLILFGMELMSAATSDLRQSDLFLSWMRDLNSPAPGVVVGILVTAMIQSSSATTAMVIVLAGEGLLTLEAGIGIVLGANVGTCITAGLSSIGAPREAQKAAVVHVIFNLMGVMIWLPFIAPFTDLVRFISPIELDSLGQHLLAAETPRQIANAHTLFNVINVAIFIGFTTPLAALAERLVPHTNKTRKLISKYLDPFFMQQPVVALDNVEREMVLLADDVMKMLRPSLQLVAGGSRLELESLAERDRQVDQRHGEIIKYLGLLSVHELTDSHAARVAKYLATASYIEQVGDIVETSMVTDARKRLEYHLKISDSTTQLLRPLHVQVVSDLESLIEGIKERDTHRLETIVEHKNLIQEMADRVTVHLAKRLVADEPKRTLTYQFEIDTLENLKRIHTLLRRSARCHLSLPDLENHADLAADETLEPTATPPRSA